MQSSRPPPEQQLHRLLVFSFADVVHPFSLSVSWCLSLSHKTSAQRMSWRLKEKEGERESTATKRSNCPAVRWRGARVVNVAQGRRTMEVRRWDRGLRSGVSTLARKEERRRRTERKARMRPDSAWPPYGGSLATQSNPRFLSLFYSFFSLLRRDPLQIFLCGHVCGNTAQDGLDLYFVPLITDFTTHSTSKIFVTIFLGCFIKFSFIWAHFHIFIFNYF